MFKYLNKNFVTNFLIIISIFALDRFSKMYVIFQNEKNLSTELFESKYLNIDLIWSGKGLNEIAVDRMSKKTVVKIDKRFFRPNEVNQSFGDSSKAKRILKWKAKINLDKLVKIMCEAEINK